MEQSQYQGTILGLVKDVIRAGQWSRLPTVQLSAGFSQQGPNSWG
jgi:hypothetical protein